MKKLRLVAATRCALVGCGGAAIPDVQNAPASVQRPMQGARIFWGDTASANPVRTNTVTIAGWLSS